MLKPIFPGKTEGSQLLEQIAILGKFDFLIQGKPNDDDLKGMSDKLTSSTKKLISKIEDIPKKDLIKLFPGYKVRINFHFFICCFFLS
jgi:hypothetical protein